MAYCDLHTHSVFSDGTYTPTQLIEEAVKIGLSAIVLSDHNTVDGLPEFLAAAEGKPIEAIAGCEFSVDYKGKELHLLGLFIPQDRFAQVAALMESFIERKHQSNVNLIRALNEAGYLIDYETIKNATPNGKFNRAHIAAELTRMGYTETIQQAFKQLLKPSVGYYKEPQMFSIWEMLDFVLEIGAVPVLAHPFLNLSEEELTEFLPEAKKRGLCGMECYYSKYDEEKTAKSLALADKFSLLPSGGSDFHGENKPDIALGIGRGNLQIPYDWAIGLQNNKTVFP